MQQKPQLVSEGLGGYLASIWIVPENRTGTLATLDPALLVKPPRGLERGYVPIVVHQQQRKEG